LFASASRENVRYQLNPAVIRPMIEARDDNIHDDNSSKIVVRTRTGVGDHPTDVVADEADLIEAYGVDSGQPCNKTTGRAAASPTSTICTEVSPTLTRL
jgi:hypothetical protein